MNAIKRDWAGNGFRFVRRLEQAATEPDRTLAPRPSAIRPALGQHLGQIIEPLGINRPARSIKDGNKAAHTVAASIGIIDDGDQLAPTQLGDQFGHIGLGCLPIDRVVLHQLID